MYKNILLPIDLVSRDTQRKAAATAAEMANKFGAKIHAMTVVPDFGMAVVGTFFPEDFEERALAAARTDLEAFVEVEFDDDILVHQIVAHGSIYREIIRCANEVSSDLIIMASHRPALRDYLLGPNAVEVITHATQSVLVVRA